MKRTKSNKRKLANPTRQRKSRIHAQRSILAIKILLVASILAFAGFLYTTIIGLGDELYKLTGDIGFATNKITIEGQQHVKKSQIAQTLKLKPGTPIFTVSLTELKDKLEEIEWIKSVTVERRLPNNIHISIVERIPLALGQKDYKLYIIDEEGIIISEENLAPYMSLPIIIGDGAEIYAPSLIRMLKEDMSLFNRIYSIIRVGERRWNVRFDDDLEVKLPEERMKPAWKQVIKLYKKNELFLPDNACIDLRIANKIFIEKK
jgi:cell division protein FtsQ